MPMAVYHKFPNNSHSKKKNMKKEYIIYIVVIAVLLLIYKSCHYSASSGSKMINLDVRVTTEPCSIHDPKIQQYSEQFVNLFTVLPGPYELIWEPKEDYPKSCSVKLKIRLRRNNTSVKLYSDSWSPDVLEKKIQYIDHYYEFETFNSEGETWTGNYEKNRLFLRPKLDLDKDVKHDFFYFLMSAPGTEFDLIIDCFDRFKIDGDIDDVIEYNKGLYIHIIPPVLDYDSDLLK